MSTYSYCYLAGALFNLGLWAVCYALRRDLRREMLVMSSVSVVLGIPHEYWLWTLDWWNPPILTNTRIGFEDFMYAIGTGGALAVYYAVLTRRRLVQGPAPGRIAAAMPLAIYFIAPFLLVYGLHSSGLHTSMAGMLGTWAAVLWILQRRPDLIGPTVFNVGLGLALSFSSFWFIELLAPGFVAAVYDLQKLSGLLIAGIPIEDLGWYASQGAMFGVYYKYATGARFAVTAGVDAGQAISVEARGSEGERTLESR